MCFAPQRRALFRHHNFQKWSGAAVFCTFWLGNVLRATTCTFLTSQLPKVVREWCVLYILTSKCASHHNGVQFFISRLASWLRTRRFSEPTFRPSGATNHWKNTVFRDFPTFSRICIFCLLTLSLLIFSLLIFLFSLPLPCSAFHLSILSEVWLLNFLRINTITLYIYIFTSSTAQGGGGSFKNGKLIGEVSCCDAKMAERTHWWIERWLSVSPFLSLFLSFSLCLSFAIYLQSYLSSHLPIYLSIHVSIDRFVYSQNPHVLVAFQWMHNPLHLPHKTTSERPKCLLDPQFFTLLTSKCASRAPQRRALFRHLNFQKCSETASF